MLGNLYEYNTKLLSEYFQKKNLYKSFVAKIISDIENFNYKRINVTNKKIIQFIKELSNLHKESSLIGEILKINSQNDIVVKINPDGKFILKLGKKINLKKIKIGDRVAIRNESYEIHKVLPSKTDPLVSLMKIENVPFCNYNMIGGLESQIGKIKEIIELPLKYPEIFEILGVFQPKGILLYGPPGTGKTLIARAVAFHSNCSFIRVSGSELVQKYIGEGGRMVREIFSIAKKNSPSIIFMDEVDSIGSHRKKHVSSTGDSEVQRTMLELLNQLDGFEEHKNIKILMATNRIDVLDPALIRPGRIDRKIKIPNPNVEGRISILRIHLKKIKCENGIDIWKIAKIIEGATGADIKAICTESGMSAIRKAKNIVSVEDILYAIDKIFGLSKLKVNHRDLFQK
ncbi:26S proteasome SU (nucleomorph) [Guillardia theta]|uniref:26S proteasome SU n=2 Tax=Guillardia theta TaxID=55529 RepID=Q98S38_GUITH|nr:26S proteasome SU [Guillardia theta]AAK39745.1 26S proteasome SU [Guillardia theta]